MSYGRKSESRGVDAEACAQPFVLNLRLSRRLWLWLFSVVVQCRIRSSTSKAGLRSFPGQLQKYIYSRMVSLVKLIQNRIVLYLRGITPLHSVLSAYIISHSYIRIDIY